jgi:hypothetical protein
MRRNDCRASVSDPPVIPCSRTGLLRASGRVGLGGHPPRPPTGPHVHTLVHTVPLMMDSPCRQTLYARAAILGRHGDTWFQVQSLGRISRPRVQHQTPPFGFSFPPPGPAGPVPRLHQCDEDAMTSCHPSRRASLPSLGGTSAPLVAFAPRRTSAPPRPGVGHPVTPAGIAVRRHSTPLVA